MNEVARTLREAVRFGRTEFVLAALVAVWLFASSFLIDATLAAPDTVPPWMPPAALAALLVDTYLTVCVYAAVAAGADPSADPAGFLRSGRAYFGRILWYKLFAAAAGAFLAALALSLVAALRQPSDTAAAVLYAIALGWVALPVYALMLTLYAGPIIILEDIPVVPAAVKSLRFVRANLPETVVLTAALGVPWAVAQTADRLYNLPATFDLAERIVRSILLAFLEIVTIRTLFAFYRTKGADHERAL